MNLPIWKSLKTILKQRVINKGEKYVDDKWQWLFRSRC